MLGTSTFKTETADKEFTVTRSFDAPRELVYRAWTEPKLFARWWGPHNTTNPVCKIDLKPGGVYRIVSESPDGIKYPMTGSYVEITPNEKIIMTLDTSEHPKDWQETLNKYRRQAGGTEFGPFRDLLTVKFVPQGKGSKIACRSHFASNVDRDAIVAMGMVDGWSQSLERLETLLESMVRK